MTAGFAHTRLITRLRAIALLSEGDANLIAALPVTLQNLPDDHDIIRDGETGAATCSWTATDPPQGGPAGPAADRVLSRSGRRAGSLFASLAANGSSPHLARPR